MHRFLAILFVFVLALFAVPAHGALTKPANDFTAGNLTSTGDGRTYTYNSENQLIRAVKTGTGAFDMEYWYDAQGRRSHSIDHLNQTETFHKHWGEMEIGDYAVSRTGGVIPTLIGTGGNAPANPAKVTGYSAQFHIILGQGVDNRIAYHKVAGDDLSFYLTNHQGSTVAMTDDNGELLPMATGGRYIYSAYGVEVSGASVTGQPFRYTGRRLDAQTGLYYYRARYYDASTGRFLQTDPIGYEDQMNLYNYVGNDPVNKTDPSGMTSCPSDPACRAPSTTSIEVVTTNNTDNSVVHQRVRTYTNSVSDKPVSVTGGSVKRLPQATAGGNAAPISGEMQGKLLDVSETPKVDDRAIEVTSGYRSQAAQDQLRAAGNPRAASRSPHTYNDAADIRVTGMTDSELADAVAETENFARVNTYSQGGDVHVDQNTAAANQGRVCDYGPCP